MKKNILIALLLSAAAFVFGCAGLDIGDRAGFSKEYIKAGGFTLMTFQRFNGHSDSIRIYIEGDGMAWKSRHRLSDDPTPANPVALRLVSVDPAGNVAYIARPGQYPLSGLPECDPKYWSGFRFAPEVIDSFNKAIDMLKERSGAKHVELAGYSGGGAIAVLVAAERSDVVSLRTVAGNLDPGAFCAYHHVSRLDGSLSPLDAAQKVAGIPQRHFVGSRDKIVPFAIVESFVRMEGDKGNERITVVDGASHNDGWHKRWKELLSMPLEN